MVCYLLHATIGKSRMQQQPVGECIGLLGRPARRSLGCSSPTPTLNPIAQQPEKKKRNATHRHCTIPKQKHQTLHHSKQ